MKYPAINISQKKFDKHKQFDVVYTYKHRISEEGITEYYIGERYFDSRGISFEIEKADKLDSGKKWQIWEIILFPINWLFFNNTSVAKIPLWEIKFSKIDESVSIEELRKILIAKIPDYWFLETETERIELKKKLTVSNSFKELMDLVAETIEEK
ncbi:hypothetical protein DNU06_16975 [Putridiphycobacter roseus]|uniref:Uncharacterized protein n=1 Tax=Putridiphycobacter roseus TaxID=2219161 RepID=A0A2W1MU75_9FLAO|nr:hypothetical protein [Putridiphycobacter roseus]PZE15639.1 hypothetical protein DNU06_16975 [Putridiphycobacter roseus]